MSEQHVTEDRLVELALGELAPDERAATARHLWLCEACRAEYASIADGVETLLAAAPRVTPPVDLAPALVGAISGNSGALAPAARVGRRRSLTLGLVAAAAFLLGVAGAVVVLENRLPPAQVVAAVGPALVTVTGDGARVGTVLPSRVDGREVLVVTLTDGRRGMRYECVLVLADGARVPSGAWVLEEPAGATWVVPRPDREVVRMDLVAESGATWATAAL